MIADMPFNRGSLKNIALQHKIVYDAPQHESYPMLNEVSIMYSEMIEKVFAQSPAIAAPVVKLNKLAAEQFEKVANVQLDACKAMAELSLSELKSLAAVSDFDSAKAFWARQGDVARAVRHQQSLYAKALSDLGNEFGSKLKKISQEDVKLAA